MRKFLMIMLLLLLLPSIGYPTPNFILIPTNRYWTTIQGSTDTRFKVGDSVNLYGVFIPAGEYGDAMVFTPLQDGRLAVRHFYLNDTSPLPVSNLRRAVHFRGVITGDSHYGYGFELSVLSMEELNLSDLLPNNARIVIRRVAEDFAYQISQINLNDISLPIEVSYNAGFVIPSDRFNGRDLEFSFIDESGNLVSQVDRYFKLPPFNDPRILRFMEVYYIYDRKADVVKNIVITARGEFLE